MTTAWGRAAPSPWVEHRPFRTALEAARLALTVQRRAQRLPLGNWGRKLLRRSLRGKP